MTEDPEQRTHERRGEQGTIFIEMLSVPDETDESGQILICNSLDISANGLRVCLDREIEVGSILQLGIELPQLPETLYLVGEVKWSTQDDPEGSNFWAGFELLNSDGTDIEQWRSLVETMA